MTTPTTPSSEGGDGWQDISVHPEAGTIALTFGTGKRGIFYADAMFDGHEWLMFHPEFDAYCEEFAPSHWQHLPKPPSLPSHEEDAA